VDAGPVPALMGSAFCRLVDSAPQCPPQDQLSTGDSPGSFELGIEDRLLPVMIGKDTAKYRSSSQPRMPADPCPSVSLFGLTAMQLSPVGGISWNMRKDRRFPVNNALSGLRTVQKPPTPLQ